MPKVHWVIPCPACGMRLRVPQQSYLGRRGRCPACRHKFTLEVPRSPEFNSKTGEPELGAITRPAQGSGELDYDYDIESLSGDQKG